MHLYNLAVAFKLNLVLGVQHLPLWKMAHTVSQVGNPEGRPSDTF